MKFDDEIKEKFIRINNIIVIQSSERLRECYIYNKHKYRYGIKIQKYKEEKYVRVRMMPWCKYSRHIR